MRVPESSVRQLAYTGGGTDNIHSEYESDKLLPLLREADTLIN
jgi:hypothetical protein